MFLGRMGNLHCGSLVVCANDLRSCGMAGIVEGFKLLIYTPRGYVWAWKWPHGNPKRPVIHKEMVSF